MSIHIHMEQKTPKNSKTNNRLTYTPEFLWLKCLGIEMLSPLTYGNLIPSME